MRFPLLLVLLSAVAVHMKTWKEVCRPGMKDFSKPGQHKDWCIMSAVATPDSVSWCNEVNYKGNCCDSCYKAEKEMIRRKEAGENFDPDYGYLNDKKNYYKTDFFN